MNQLQDSQMIRELYEASLAGVPIVLNVRGLCCLRAGVPGLSPTIQVFSTLGRFLEHSRIYRFENGGAAEFFIGSADLMTCKLSRRVEAVAPVCDPVIKAELEEILRTYEEDNCSAWDMQPDGEYVRRHPAGVRPGGLLNRCSSSAPGRGDLSGRIAAAFPGRCSSASPACP